MLQDKHKGLPITTYGFLIAVELAEGTSVDVVTERLAESLGFVEGVDRVECSLLGTLECVDEQTATN